MASKEAKQPELTAEQPEAVQYDPMEPVKIKLARKKGVKYQYVSVNNHSYQIQLGVEVDVPRYIKEVLDNSVQQDEHTAELIEQLTEHSDY